MTTSRLRVRQWLSIFAIGLSLGATTIRAQSAAKARVAESSAGEAGHRQDKAPLDRIDNRIQNRIPSRLRQRIDRYYDPQQIDARSQLAIAQANARAVNRSRRR